MRDDQIRKLVDAAHDAANVAHRRAETLHDTLAKEISSLENAIINFGRSTNKRIDTLHDSVVQLENLVERLLYGQTLNPIKPISEIFADLQEEEVDDCVGSVDQEAKEPADPCFGRIEGFRFIESDGTPYIAQITQALLDQGFSHGSIKEMICSGNAV